MNKEHLNVKPVLLIDVDGVISLFGFAQDAMPAGSFHWVNGVLHYISRDAGRRLLLLSERYDLVWATGWEETANEYLPSLLGLPGELPCLSFDCAPRWGSCHWKIGAIDTYVGQEHPVAWIDDNHDESCHDWASSRPGPTLLVATPSHSGIEDSHVDQLLAWADQLEGGDGRRPQRLPKN